MVDQLDSGKRADRTRRWFLFARYIADCNHFCSYMHWTGWHCNLKLQCFSFQPDVHGHTVNLRPANYWPF